jgi:hypothetical protein
MYNYNINVITLIPYLLYVIWAISSVVERAPDKGEVSGSSPG